ncbi:MAG: bifunctional UDP-N-acetylglucosamine diphosphorylase/glucosamine-1-phosphate N-acetyltransferase GlmU [Planctomycetaceae bacterium]
MNQRPLAAVVLAAGKGKRMRSPLPKVLLEACGRPLVIHVLEALGALRARPTVLVHGHGGALVKEALKEREVVFAHQEEQLGTGHAVQCALPALQGFVGDVVVLCGDTPLLTGEVLSALVADHREKRRALTVLSAELEDPGSLGRIVRGAGDALERIVEFKDAAREPAIRAIREINTGVMVIDAALLPGALARLSADNAQREYYLTDVPGLLLADGRRADVFRTADAGAALGVNTPRELAHAARLLRRRTVGGLMDAGVVVEDPETTLVDSGVEVGEGTILYPFTYLAKGARIGRSCRIGPFASVGEGTVLGAGAVVGPFVDARRCLLDPGAAVVGHALLRDLALGAGASLGAGTMAPGPASGGGRAVVGEGARIGAGAILEAPVTVGDRAVLPPGAVPGREGEALSGERNHG